MKDIFKEYLRPSESDFQQMWEEGILSFDASALLVLYRSSVEARTEFFGFLDQIKDQLWLPHKVCLEFFSNRLEVISKQIVSVNKLMEALNQITPQVEKAFGGLKRSPLIDSVKLRSRIINSIKYANNKIRHAVERDEDYSNWQNWINNDPVLESLDNLFHGRIGTNYNEETLKEKYKEAEKRYKEKAPPGYKDEKKDQNRFGDYIIWCQLMDHAITEKKPVIFVTEDQKEDWWWSISGRTIGPRPELLEEMRINTGQMFWLYTLERFMKYAKEHINKDVSQEVIDELKDIGKQSKLTEPEETGRQGLLPLGGGFFWDPAISEAATVFTTGPPDHDISHFSTAATGLDTSGLEIKPTLSFKIEPSSSSSSRSSTPTSLAASSSSSSESKSTSSSRSQKKKEGEE